MTNKEKFKEEILNIACDGESLAITVTNKPAACGKIDCKDCIAFHSEPCNKMIKEWLNKEYIKPKHFTEKEKAVLEACPNLKYAARNKNGYLYFYTSKPIKETIEWNIAASYNNSVRADILTDECFDAILWEDNEPVSREEILNS